MSLRHDVSQPSSMIEILTSFLLGFRQTNGDPGITTGNYPLVVPQPAGTVDWTSALELATIGEWVQHPRDVGFPMTGSSQIFAAIEVASTSAHGSFGGAAESMRGTKLHEPEAEVDVEREVPVLLPPQRQYTRVFRVKHLGRAEPLISSDDMVSTHEF